LQKEDCSFPDRINNAFPSIGIPRRGCSVTNVPPTDKPREGFNLVLAKSATTTEVDETAKRDDTTCLPVEGKVTSQTALVELDVEGRHSKKRPNIMLIPAKNPEPNTVKWTEAKALKETIDGTTAKI
jgi:hypothetical protein